MRFEHWLPKFIPGYNVNGVVLFGRAFFKKRKNEVPERLYLHEKEHLRQSDREGMLLFKLKYSLEFLCNLIKYRSFIDAYYNISYEVEARQAEKG